MMMIVIIITVIVQSLWWRREKKNWAVNRVAGRGGGGEPVMARHVDGRTGAVLYIHPLHGASKGVFFHDRTSGL